MHLWLNPGETASNLLPRVLGIAICIPSSGRSHHCCWGLEIGLPLIAAIWWSFYQWKKIQHLSPERAQGKAEGEALWTLTSYTASNWSFLLLKGFLTPVNDLCCSSQFQCGESNKRTTLAVASHGRCAVVLLAIAPRLQASTPESQSESESESESESSLTPFWTPPKFIKKLIFHKLELTLAFCALFGAV